MEQTIKLILIPIIGAFIGFFTNYLALRMLFRPREKILGIQGVIPKNKNKIARKISDASPVMIPGLEKIKEIPRVGEKALGLFKFAVEHKIKNLKNKEIEDLVLKVTKTELRFIAIFGAIIGFLIGIVQVIIFLI